MPGHVKKTEGPDPCPDQWLIVSDELKVKLKSKPYDPKKSCWVPEKGTGGYLEGLIESLDGEKVSVKLLESKEVSLSHRNKTKMCIGRDKKKLFLTGESLQEGPSWPSQPSQV